VTPEQITREFARRKVKYAYHMAHIGQVRSIAELGLLSKDDVDARSVRYQDIALESAQGRRDRRKVVASADGSDATIRHLGIHAMASLYFNPRNPMMYRRKEERLCIFAVAIPRVINGSRRFCFSDGNLASHHTKSYYDPSDLDRIPWDLVRSDRWVDYDTGQTDERIKRATCAEFLVESAVPPDCLVAVLVSSERDGETVTEAIGGTSVEGSVWLQESLFFGPDRPRRKYVASPRPTARPAPRPSPITSQQPDRATRRGKVLVRELAAELGMTSAATVEMCGVLGVPVKNDSSSLAEAYADMVRRRAHRDGLTGGARRDRPESAPNSGEARFGSKG
jgi:hypothetical protein